MSGKSRLAQHLVVKDEDRERLGVAWSADYAFMGSEESEEGMQPTLVMYDDDKKSFWAMGVKQKGVSEQVVQYGVGVVDQSAYRGEKITFKTDQEPSIVALKSAVSAARMGETVPIESPARASKSNGMMEAAIRVWQDQLRTIKHFTEARLGRRIEVDGALFSWLIPFCADIINKFRVGADGRTAYERITAHKCKHFVLGFCEMVDFIPETDKSNIHKADSRVHTGVFLGYAWGSTEYLIATKNDIYKCRTVKRRAEKVGYDAEFVDHIVVRYDDYILKGAKTTVAVRMPQQSGSEEIPVRGGLFFSIEL